ncbi:hypothetical protein [Actinoplanes campanulatus]|nr:hypothetical protein [Actinoplanes capillaceus]
MAFIEAQAGPVLAAMDWAEDEIIEASRRHPAQADLLFHAFRLLPGDVGPGMRTEFLYRGHFRELLERVVADDDPRPATAAEICLLLAQISPVVPMHGPSAGLYFRMWLAAFPNHPVTDDQADNQRHYEHVYGTRIDELDAMLRSKLADPHRQFGDVKCDGRHLGRAVNCRFATGSNTTS